METVLSRRRTSFNLRKDVLEILKQKAKQSNRSLSSYVENVLIDDAYSDLPNEKTQAAIMEARQGKRDPKEIYSDVNDLMKDLMTV